MAARVLLADESVTVQKTVSSMLADEGIEVVAVSDGQQAIEWLDDGGSDLAIVDLVIAGLSLPKVSGEELCRYIKSSRRLGHVPVILLVGAFEPLDHMEARRVGADAQLAKPPQSRPLIQTVRSLIEKSSHSRPSLMPLFGREHGSLAEEATASDSNIEQSRPQSVFFKPYKPPPDLTVEQLALEVRALPARVQSNKLDRKPERVPEGAAVILMTALAILAVVALALWFLTRSSDTVPDNMPVARQTPAIDAQPVASEQPEPSNRESSTLESSNNEPSNNEPSNNDAVADRADNNGAATAARDSRERSSRGEQNNRTSIAPVAAAPVSTPSVAAPALMREQMLARARTYEDRGMLTQAEEHYRAVLHNFPGDSTSRFALNRLAARLSAERREQGGRASREAGLRAFRSGNYSEAINGLTAAINAGRNDTVVLYSLGTAQWKLGRSREAQAAFERCLVANPNYAPAMVGLAQVKAAAGKRAEALALLNRALQLGGGAEFSPERIREMIARYTPRAASRP